MRALSWRPFGKAAREMTDMHGTAGAKAAEQRAQAAATEALYLLGALKQVLGELEEPAAGEVAAAVTGLLELSEPLLTQHACEALTSLFAPTAAGAAAERAAALSGRTQHKLRKMYLNTFVSVTQGKGVL